MFKHRDNIMHPPLIIDPQGSGVTMKAVRHAQDQQQYAAMDMASRSQASATVAGRKRPRDIRGIDRFKQVVFGEKGLPRFHAMIARNPILMYPPEGIEEARRRVHKKQKCAAEADAVRGKQRMSQDGDKTLWAMFEERRAAEDGATGCDESALDGTDAQLQHKVEDDTNSQDFASSSLPAVVAVGGMSDEELANYHHQQLDALIGLYYEFNHLTFMKLPMNDTLQLLQRCGKDAMAHSMEFETQLRMQRETRLNELKALEEEERQLKQRQLEAQEAVFEMQVQAAEEEQGALVAEDDSGFS